MGRLFGTDGVRGLANDTLRPELALQVAAAAARVLAPESPGLSSPAESRPLAVVGRDPRVSGQMLEAAVVAGLTSAGVDVVSVGVVPTPAVAYLTGRYHACLGVMISASHNPMPDNGIKIFAPGGHKLDDALEDRIAELVGEAFARRPTGGDIGRVLGVSGMAADEDSQNEYRLSNIHRQYLDHVVATAGRLDGLKVVVDCANGAASEIAPAAYRAAGAEVIAINASPDGRNINRGGSTHLELVQHAVLEHGAEAGLAHDGDADRCLAVDAAGNVVDGDAILAILALGMREAGALPHDTLVATVMSNLGLHLAMREAGITVRTTAVGDRYVLEELHRGGFGLGGEQSGHVVFPEFGTTGDGVLTGLQVLTRIVHSGKSLGQLASVLTPVPQVLVNVAVTDKSTVMNAPRLQTAIRAAEEQLGAEGRILVRPSGTEHLVRVMVEATDPDHARRVADDVAQVVSAV